ncbi:hypothetical protein ACWOFR_10470 [Carnobacterium gallinarum]|uniref:hypothetical protein n=1 Tax=Carnobacterium gallinarum TaxID=2749 RepID=UPI000557D72F|nr:hypothetical protein [Carnobacterium gallinarum]
MFVFPKIIIQAIGRLFGYFFNFFIVGVGIKMCILSFQTESMTTFLTTFIITWLFSCWTGYLVYSGFKKAKAD